jgi:hypothetical protein
MSGETGRDPDPTIRFINEVIQTMGTGPGATPGQPEVVAGSHAESASAENVQHEQAFAELSREYDRIREDVSTYPHDMPEADKRAASTEIRAMALTLMVESAIRGDIRAIEEKYLPVLTATSIEDPDWQATTDDIYALFLAANAGSRQAQQEMDGLLTSEVHAAMSAEFNPALRNLPLLHRLVEACVEAGQRPDELIEKYLPPEGHYWSEFAKWGLYVSYYELLSGREDAPQEEVERARNRVKRIYYVLPQRLSEQFDLVAVSLCPGLFAEADVEESVRVFSNFWHSYLRAPLQGNEPITDESILLAAEKVYGHIATHPEKTLPPEWMEDLQRVLEGGQNQGQISGRWGIDKLLIAGASPQEVIEKIDLLTGAEALDENREDAWGTYLRDNVLGEYAAAQARQGNTTAAKTYLAAIGNTRAHAKAATECAQYAIANDELDALRPGEEELASQRRRRLS